MEFTECTTISGHLAVKLTLILDESASARQGLYVHFVAILEKSVASSQLTHGELWTADGQRLYEYRRI